MDNDADAASELVLQFCEITGCEPGLAAKYLAVNDQQLELAVTLFMENGGTDLVSTAEYKESSGSSSTSRATTTMAAGDSYSSSDAVRAPIAARSGVLVAGGGGGSGGMMDEDDDYYTGHYDTPQAYIRQQQHSSSSSSAAFRLHPSIPTYANQANPFMVRGRGMASSSSSAPEPFRNANEEASYLRGGESRDDVEDGGGGGDSSGRLSRMFRPPFEIMFQDSFDRAKQTAHSSNKWIMVTLFETSEFQCHAMIRDVWNDKKVQACIKEHFVFCYYGSSSHEGIRHTNLYPIKEHSAFPYFCIIDPLTGERVAKWEAPEKLWTADLFMDTIEEFLSIHFTAASSGSNGAAKAVAEDKPKARTSVSDLSEEEQLRLAIAASMNSMQKSSSLSSAAASMDQSETIVIDDDEIDRAVVEAVVASIDAFESIRAVKRDEPSVGDTTRIQFRLPDGSRLVRKFLKSDPVLYLFQFIKASGVEGAATKRFDLMAFRESLLGCIKKSVVDANLLNGVVMVEFTE